MTRYSLVAAAVASLFATMTAQAQSSVTLYGLVDGGYNRVSGLRQGTTNTIASGIMEGTRFGMRGSEDLGGGYKGIFTLESRVEVDTGAVSNRPNSGLQLPDRVGNSVLASTAGLPLSVAVRSGVVSSVNNTLASSAFGVNLAGNLFDRQAYGGLITPFGAFTLAGNTRRATWRKRALTHP